MKRRPILGSTVLVAILAAGCSGSQSMQPYVANQRTVDASLQSGTYRKIYDFGSGTDGRFPVGALIQVGQNFYGATFAGGKNNSGTVFSVTDAGAERLLHSFSALGDHSDGQLPGPGSALLNVNGTLYGTTSVGGTNNANQGACCGTIYSISLNGTEQVVYNFPGGSGGRSPSAGLLNVNGTFYGTTVGGGTYDTKRREAGTAFSFNPATRKARVLHSFGQRPDGREPQTALSEVSGTLYGVTAAGARGDGGTVYSLSRTGSERVLHSFARVNDGATPYSYSGLLDANGILYGTTVNGGTYDSGIVFSLTGAGIERVLYVFGSKTGDGLHPSAGLINVNGTFYGSTSEGGKYGGGTLFSITPDGTERVLHNFGNGTDGAYPQGALLYVNGTLYGTTTWGGKYVSVGAPVHSGTIFALTLP